MSNIIFQTHYFSIDKIKRNITPWLMNNIWYIPEISWDGVSTFFKFKEERDAIAFKLAWSE